MPLPEGFKVHGAKIAPTGLRIPPIVKKLIAILDSAPSNELFTTWELANRAKIACNGSSMGHPALSNYREKVDNKLFWGSKKSIAQLRKQLAAPEAHNEKS